MADKPDQPDQCPACGGDPVESAIGWVCDDCDATLMTADSRGDADVD